MGQKMQYSLTPKQAGLLAFIRSYMATSGGVAPSFSEMMDGCGGSSKAGIHCILSGLEERGNIMRMKHRSRSIVLLEAGQ